MTRLFPHPILSVVIAIVWILLVNEITAGQIVIGIFLGWAIPKLTSPYWPDRPRIRRPGAVIAYMGIVLWDIVVSNIQVAYWVLFRRGNSLRSRFVTVPLDLTTAEAITALAGTITMTPGTVSADLSADGRSLLVHCLETDDPDATVAQIKDRYERRLKEIFE
ncbi:MULTISPECIES: Na+/H+ antiporter subunit E [Microvirga]|uniref:Na+/H+ antiporter subunit E n=1 Tax=Microvirga TaxID=186650 RepID=UPI001CFF983F|nr:Na+/H+ antiporter subunit E [Microvirga lenta]MCB5175381.1 Na+/H+ antiporter subunit E [Microvirga lenta]